MRNLHKNDNISVKDGGFPAVKEIFPSKFNLEFYNRLKKYSLIMSKIRETQHGTE
jgi:hypothetical protein